MEREREREGGMCEGMGAKEDVVSLGSGSSLIWLGQRSVKERGGR